MTTMNRGYWCDARVGRIMPGGEKNKLEQSLFKRTLSIIESCIK
jgi:hypothetical protein